MAGVADTNYNSTLALTDVGNAGGIAAVAVNNTGMSQEALGTLIVAIAAGIAAMNAKLDADGGVTDTNFAATYDLTALIGRNDLRTTGIHQGDLYAVLLEIETNWNAILAKLDADAGVEDEDYAATHAVDLSDLVSGTGIGQAEIVSFLDNFITQFNDCLDKLDADESS